MPRQLLHFLRLPHQAHFAHCMSLGWTSSKLSSLLTFVEMWWATTVRFHQVPNICPLPNILLIPNPTRSFENRQWSKIKNPPLIFIGPESDHWQLLSMTNSLTNSLLFRLDWRDPWVWRCQLARYCSGLHNLWQPCSQALRKWREKEKMKRKWRENEEMEWDSLSTFLNFLFISSLSIHFLYQTLSHFVAKC